MLIKVLPCAPKIARSFQLVKSPKLDNDFYICALDTPGYGFSDKPKGSYHYTILDDARLTDYFIRDIAKITDFTLVTHDKGDSVGLAMLNIYQAYLTKPYTLHLHVILNGNIFLPLAKLTSAQKLLLNPIVGPILSSFLDGELFAKGLARSTYTPELANGEIQALASIFDYQGGTSVEYAIIQYLNERKVNEVTWLKALANSDVPTTLLWGDLDEIAPVAVPDYAWENYLKQRAVTSTYWRIPCANHYLQVDQPAIVANIIRAAISTDKDTTVTGIENCQPHVVK
jgi:pimeloyl-ACP methyl ester carboxylesterase